ncbi:DUF481 domain-containing protein [Pseudomonas typographi]|uniref:DUF481 domain-containing protein n=1 Tax=Pseudomonas typographi TaxID=2715964 RepID=A0ABR7YW89_9PSED|nr:DUF481 domain-containing protein [Pseudomonas typographi]MBD1552535.1 DUF481 domain-containing protein [Pseudomonas typographi]MBD1585626.1 DUF481 domain-containing protein [Pseudomonas typographi]MBD1597461.1 DUF481 domain-containing protein [Pseudomonas typographi]
MLSRTLLCVAVASGSTCALADTVWLKNGDRLTGTITVYDGGKLMLTTDYGGAIPIDMTKVKTLESNQQLLVKQGNDHTDHNTVSKALQPADEGKVILANGTAPQTIDLASIQQIMKPRPLIQDFTWKGNVDAAMDFKRAENDTDDYNVAFKTSARHGLWRHTGDGEYNREKEDGSTNTNNWNAEYALDRFFTDHWFWQGRFNYKHDNVEDLARQRQIGTGPGYQFWDDELGAFSLGSLINNTSYKYSDGTSDSFYSVSMKWDYNRYLIGKTFELFTTGELGRPLSNVADYSLDAEVGVRYKVTDWASLNVKYEKDLITGTQDGNDLDSSRVTAGFGVTW